MKEFYSIAMEKKLKIAIQALEDIRNPLSKLKRSLEPEGKLDGPMTVSIIKDPVYLKSIAAKALKEITGVKS